MIRSYAKAFSGQLENRLATSGSLELLLQVFVSLIYSYFGANFLAFQALKTICLGLFLFLVLILLSTLIDS